MTDEVVPQARALAELVARVAQTLSAGGGGGDDAAARTQAAAEVEQLQAIVADTERQRVPGSPAGLGFDLAQLGDALRVFTAWLRAPSAANEAEARRAMAELQATLGPLVGWDPEREDAARRAQYRQEARAALDEIFRDKPAKP
jgi:hypothetical protein